MRRKRKSQVRAFSIFASLLMIFSLIMPGIVGAEGNGSSKISLNDTKSTLKAKMSNTLMDEFEGNDKVTFLIKFNEQADVEAASAKARAEASSTNLSAFNMEIAQRSAVISELKATALQSQASVKKFLDQEVAKGNAKDVNPFYIVNGIAVTATKEVAEKIATFAEVEKITPNGYNPLYSSTITRDGAPSVEEISLAEKEALGNNLQNTEWNVDRVNAPDVWGMGFDGSGIIVANMDTGVDWTHPALQGKYAGYDPVTGEVDHTYSFYDPVYNQEAPHDVDSHGTHVMGTMVGGEASGSNQVGVAPGAKWIAVQAFTADASGVGAYDADLLAGAEWLLAPGGDVTKAPDVVNNSWGGGPGIDEWFRDAVIAWRAAGIVPVMAAGNVTLGNPGGPGSVSTPANYPESFAVGNTTRDDMVASGSLRGPSPSPYNEIKPDVSAPGTGIRSSIPGNGYASYNGTSMAAPHVAGIVALLRQVNSNLTVDQIEQILMETARVRTDSQYPESPNNGYGHGIVDAFAAVTSIADGLGTFEGFVTMDGEDTEAPVYEHTPPSGMLAGKALKLSVFASDNVSVTSVELSYNGNTLEAEKVSGNHKSGEFEVTVPAEDISGDSFTYQWVITDYGGNEVTSDEFSVELTEPLFFESFATNPEWSTFEGNTGALTWEWGVPTTGPNGAATGTNVYATNLSGEYNNNEFSWLDMPAITLPEGDAFIELEHWFNLESGWDYGYLVATNDPEGEYQVLEGFTGASSGWETVTYDLSEFSGDEVYIAFVLETDNSGTRAGWYLDNVTITDVPLVISSSSELASNVKAETSGVPLDATVSVLESGRSVKTNPIDGSYSMLHEAGTFTLVAEAYGFASQEQTVELGQDSTEQANFVLEELPSGVVSGTITSAKTGTVIEGATVYLVEDANVHPVETDAEGNYDLTAYEGDYTLKVVAENYHPQEVSITVDGDVTQDIQLDPFYTVPGGEIGYDDGTPENARVFYDAGNGWAVKMSLPVGVEQALVTDGVFQFHSTDWPAPGDTPFAVEVWSAGADGMPAEKLAGPVDADAIRDLNEWTVVDLREHNIQVDGDFYMVYVQSQPNPNAPGLATDESSGSQGRSYEYAGGAWNLSPAEEGNYMIRARIDVAIGNPVIDGAFDNLVTNDTDVTVTGLASNGTELNLYNNGELAGTTTAGSNGEFAVDVSLAEGDNVLKAVTLVNGEEATESEEVTIVLDSAAPVLSIDSPVDGEVTNADTVTVEGTVTDDHFDSITVNGKEAAVNEDGSFNARVMLNPGENTIDVVANDLAGNSTSQSITLTADFDAPTIENVEPASDQYVSSGDEVKVSFTSDSEGGLANFKVSFPSQDVTPMSQSSHPMEEVEPGVYEGTWIVPEVDVDNAVIVVELTDAAGNTSTQTASGVVNVTLEKVARVAGDIRYDTAIEMSKEGFDSADTVILARGLEFADALAGVPLAYKLDAPILLTPSDKLWDGILGEIDRLGASNVVILGGTGAVSDAVVSGLEAADLNVSRIAGETRFETAALIASEVAPNGAEQVAVANGMDFPDALSVAAHAAKAGMPILLTYENKLPEGTVNALADLGVSETLVVGGENVIQANVLRELPNAERVSGKDRYETNMALANYFGLDAKHIYVATGNNYADALTGSVLAAKSDSAVVLVHKIVPASVASYMQETNVKRVTIFGGKGAVSSDVENALIELLQ